MQKVKSETKGEDKKKKKGKIALVVYPIATTKTINGADGEGKR